MKGRKKYLWQPLLRIALAYVVLVIGYSMLTKTTDERVKLIVYLGVALYMCLFYVVPILFLFYNHYKHSSGKEVVEDDSRLLLTCGNNNYVFPTDIIEVEQYQTNSKFHNRFDWTLWGEYGFYCFITSDGSKIYFSNLLLEGFEDVLHTSNVKRKIKGFPMLKRDKIHPTGLRM